MLPGEKKEAPKSLQLDKDKQPRRESSADHRVREGTLGHVQQVKPDKRHGEGQKVAAQMSSTTTPLRRAVDGLVHVWTRP